MSTTMEGGRVGHETEVLAKAQRRRFTAAEKLRVLREADRCTKSGEVSALLQREGLYSSRLSTWREARRRGEPAGLAPGARGPQAKPIDPRDKKLVERGREIARLQRQSVLGSHFKTLKDRPEFPQRFGGIEDARGFCGDFFPWYNAEHHHVGLGLLTRHPERSPNGRPSPRPRPTAVADAAGTKCSGEGAQLGGP
ncbi:MAG TPA: hypothetical protein VMS93_12790 [Candidatus Saccharimonadales bacterium]|nr:hypothetical protein [Candidatus Saccharimonadales bacterium]